MTRLLTLFVLVPVLASAKGTKTVIRVVDSSKVVNTAYWTALGRAGYSKTNCDGTETATPTPTGATAIGSTKLHHRLRASNCTPNNRVRQRTSQRQSDHS
jgi:hypothetical protein